MTENVEGFSDGRRVVTLISDDVVFFSEDLLKETLRHPQITLMMEVMGVQQGLRLLADMVDNTALETWKAFREREE